MPLDPQEVFKVMQCAYRNGVLDKFLVITGPALEGVIADTGMNLGDLLNRLDEAKEETVMKIDRLLDRLGPFIKYADNDRLMRLVSRLLDVAVVRNLVIKTMRAVMSRMATGEPRPGLAVKVKALAGRAA